MNTYIQSLNDLIYLGLRYQILRWFGVDVASRAEGTVSKCVAFGVLVGWDHLAGLAAGSKLLLSLTARKRRSKATSAQTLIVVLALVIACSTDHILVRAEAAAAAELLSNNFFLTHDYFLMDFAGFLFFDKLI